ncbi:PqiC family protein [Paraburkholderia guartelaensis]|uniref:PqiC family protein n=1 Tax=Paraburkholderia guartelaensis TaxID=2546446 RepID=UPI002AB70D83|nr:PqiC family protein [Paraburkholderia guartelaensis]
MMRRHASRASIARLLRAVVLVGVGLGITACGHSAPTRYVTLNATPAQAPLATAAMAPVQLSAVHIPAVLDRPEVVTHVAPNPLAVDDNDRWGAPLGQMMRSTLAQDLLPRLPAGAFVFPDAPAPAGTRTLVVTVLDCNASAGGTLTLQVAWTLLAGQPARTTMSQEAALSAQVEGHDAAAQAAALSRVLGELADRIAASIAVR